MNQKSLLLSYLAVLILCTTAASASMNDYPVLRGDAEIPVKCEGWFDQRMKPKISQHLMLF